MEDWFEMNLASTTIWVEAGEEFGVFFTTYSYGAFTVTYETSDDEDTPLLIETADYYVEDPDNDEYFQFNAWSVDRYTEIYEATVNYYFEYDDVDRSDYDFTVYIERQESESEAWEITSVEDLIATFEDLCATCGFVNQVEFMQDGDSTYAWAREGDEIGFIFFSERSDIDIAFEFDEDNTLLYSTGTTADAVRYQVEGEEPWYYWYRSFAVEWDPEETEATIDFRIKAMSFGSALDFDFLVNFELDDWNSDNYYSYGGDYSYYYYSDYEYEYSSFEGSIRNANDLHDAIDENMDDFYVFNLDAISDGEFKIYPERGQVIGLLGFSQNEEMEIDFEELFLDAEVIPMFPTADFAYELESHGIFYWFISYAVDRKADETYPAAEIAYVLDDGEDEINFSIIFEFGNVLEEPDLEQMENWEEFDEEVLAEFEEDDVGVEEWYIGCWDSTNGAVDSAGDSCAWYADFPDYCGDYDTFEFFANQMCCVCQFFGAQDVDLDAIYDDCSDTNDGALDTFHDGCEWYNEFPDGCGLYDDDDFTATEMCCACKDLEEEQLYFIDENADIDIDAVDEDLIIEDAEGEDLVEEAPVFETTDEPIAADEI